MPEVCQVDPRLGTREYHPYKSLYIVFPFGGGPNLGAFLCGFFTLGGWYGSGWVGGRQSVEASMCRRESGAPSALLQNPNIYWGLVGNLGEYIYIYIQGL